MPEKPAISSHALRSVPELKYANAENVVRYRAIMRFFYQEYKRLRYWLRPEEVYEGVMDWGVLEGYSLEQCLSDLEQLTEWQNLASRHDGGRAATLEEYMRKKMQYLLRPYSIEIERLLETLEKVTGYGGSLESTLFDAIAEKIYRIRLKALDIEPLAPGEALTLWTELYGSFVTLHENAADYIASLQTAKAEEMMMTESFLVFKEKLTGYLQNFVQALQKSAYKIEGNLEQISEHMRDVFLQKVAEDEAARPRLEKEPDREELLAELQQGWDNLRRWFLGDGRSASELTLLERATKDAIARIVRCVIRIQERKRSGLSRKKELEYLAQWFDGLSMLEESHCLAAYAFGLFPTRHLQGEDLRDSDRADMSMWNEAPASRFLRSRSRRRIGRSDTEAVRREQTDKIRNAREAYMKQQEEERLQLEAMLLRGMVSMSELESPVPARLRRQLLYWVGRCISAGNHEFRTSEGIVIRLENPRTDKRAEMICEDGDLNLPDYRLGFSRSGGARAGAYSEVAAASHAYEHMLAKPVFLAENSVDASEASFSLRSPSNRQ